MSTPEDRLAELGHVVPEVVAPLAAYVPAVLSGSYVYVSGQLPTRDGKPLALGLLGADVSVEQGYECAQASCLNALAAVKALVGDLSQVTRIVKLTGFVASAPGFTEHPQVINGASELLGELFGDAGRHARAAVGVACLPLGVPVEVEMVVEVA